MLVPWSIVCEIEPQEGFPALLEPDEFSEKTSPSAGGDLATMLQKLERVRPVKDMTDVKEIYQLALRNDPETAAEIGAICDKEHVYDVIKETPGKPSDAGAFRLRTDGIVKALSGMLEVAQSVCLVPDGQCDSWPGMVWGSLGFALKQFPTQERSVKRNSCLPYLGYLEDLTTLASLPSPPTGWDNQKYPHLNDTFRQLYAELACGLLSVALFLLRNPTHKSRTAEGDRYTDFQAEHQRTVSTLRCLGSVLVSHSDRQNNPSSVSGKLLQLSSERIPIYISRHFQGRDEYLKIMHAALVEAQERPAVLSVHGLPGVGKTQLAARYCKEFTQEYQATFWIDADSSIKIKEGLSRYATWLELPKASIHGDSAANAEILISWLQSCDLPWLIVFDNVDDVTVLPEYWPTGSKGHIIITHRNPYNADFRTSESIRVRPLDLEDSMALFYTIIGQEKKVQHTSDIEELFSEWGGVPLALNQIGNFVRRRELTLQRFVNMYKRNTPRIYGAKNDIDEYPYSVVTAFAVQDLDENAKALLHAMCFLDPDNVPAELLLSNFDEGETLNGIESDFEYLDAVVTLCKRSLLIQVENDLSIHRLVQSVAFNSMSNAERERAFEAVLSVLVRRFPRENHGMPMWHDRQRCASYLPHVLFLCKRYPSVVSKRKSVEFAELLSACTWYMFERGLFAEAQPLLALGIDVFPESSENLTVATLCFNLAGIRCECNRITEAHALSERMLRIREAILAPDDPLLGNAYYSMGIVCMEDGKLDKALEYNRKAVQIHEQCHAHDQSPTAFSYGNLGLCYLKLGELDLASECMEKSEILWKNSCGDGSDRYATIMYYMGNLRLAQDRIDDARRLHTKAFEILRKVTPDHIKTGLSYHKLACFYSRDGDFDKAIEYLEQAIAIFQKQFDPTPRVARSLYKMSEVYRAAGEMSKAEVKRYQAEEMRRSIATIPFDPGQPEIVFDKLVPSYLG